MSVATRAKQPLKSWKNQQKKGENIQMEIEYLHTKSMIADYLTKPLIGELFYKLRDLLLGYTTLWEGCGILLSPRCVFQNFAGKYFTQSISDSSTLYSN